MTGGRCACAPPVPAGCCQLAAPARAIRTAAAPARLRPTSAAVPGAAARGAGPDERAARADQAAATCAPPLPRRSRRAPVRPARRRRARRPWRRRPGPGTRAATPPRVAPAARRPRRSRHCARRFRREHRRTRARPRAARAGSRPASRAARIHSHSDASPASASSSPPSRCAIVPDPAISGPAVELSLTSSAPTARIVLHASGSAISAAAALSQARAIATPPSVGDETDHQRSRRIQAARRSRMITTLRKIRPSSASPIAPIRNRSISCQPPSATPPTAYCISL